MAKWTLIESKNKKVNKTQSQNSSSKSSQQLTGDELLHKFENTCYFYKLGKCKFGKECKKDHPKFCQKFINQGIIKNNPKGCDGKCNNLHPIACRDSLKSRECEREKCRFYHLKGTKKPAPKLVNAQIQNTVLPQPQVQAQSNIPVVPQPMGNQAPAQQVFQADQTVVIALLQQMMEEMRSWRTSNQNQNSVQNMVQPLLRPQNWNQSQSQN